jgi:hypothetical protein
MQIFSHINKRMATLTDFIVNYGDVVELDFPNWDVKRAMAVLDKHPGWKVYQPHKPGYNRYGLSVTSLDGGYSGEPDLYSLREYQQNTGKSYWEADFKRRTSIVEFIPEINPLLDYFEPAVGRTHFLRLDKGGFFPPHRDNGAIVDVPTYRILVPINKFNINDMKWIHEEKILNLHLGTTYFINTTKIHSLFSFVDNCVMLVLNVVWSPEILAKMVKRIVPI